MKRFFPTIIASVVLALSLFSLSACTKTPEENPIDTLEERVAAMTLEEKLGQMIQAERNAINSSAVNALNLGSILSGGGSHPNPNTPQGWLTYDHILPQCLIELVLRTSRSSMAWMRSMGTITSWGPSSSPTTSP
jgi:hypothetical protein